MRSLIVLFAVCFSTSVFSQNEKKVMLIGEKDAYYEQLVGECGNMLLMVTEESMDKAYTSWTGMLSDMEAYSEEYGLDIKGVKLWINLFWNADGSVRNIFYYPKPTSRNMDFEKLTAFLEDFATSYKFSFDSESCFSHYASASFPIRHRLQSKESK